MKYKAMVLLGILLLLGACKIEKPSLPVWDIDIKVPLINEHYYVSSLVDSVHLVVDENDLLYLTAEGDVETSSLDQVELRPNIEVNDLQVSSGLDTLQAYSFDDSQGFAILTYGEVASGEIRIQVANVHPEAGDWLLEIEIPTITDAQGQPLHQSYTQPTPFHSISLASYHIGILDAADPIDEIQLRIVSTSALPDGSHLADISFELNQPIKFHVFQGRLSNYEILATGSTGNIDIEYPHNLDEAITLSDAYIEIAVSNQMGFSCEFEGNFKATRGDTVISIPIVDDEGNNYRIEAATMENPTHLVFRNLISELMQIMPEHIEITDVKFTINSASGFGTIHDSDAIYAHYAVLAPFRFILHDSLIAIDNPTQISISEENQERIRRNLLSASLCLKVLNTIPLGTTAYAYFADHELIDPNDPETYSFMKQMILDSSLSSPAWQEPELMTLNKAELDLFAAPQVYLKWVFQLEESSDLVEIYAGPNDFIWVQGQLLASLRVED